MSARFKINGKDAGKEWGALLGDTSVSALLAPAASKERVTNESRIAHGIQVLSEQTYLQSRSVSIVVYIRATGYAQFAQRLNGLIDELTKGVAVIEVAELKDVKFKMLYESSSQFTQINGRLGKVVLKFNEPNPTDRQ